MTASGAPRYLYGIIATGSLGRAALVGLDAKPVEEIAEGPIAAAVSSVRLDHGVVEVTRDRLSTHLHVLQEISERTTVVPMRFGTVAPDDSAIRDQVLVPQSRRLQRLLRALEGK